MSKNRIIPQMFDVRPVDETGDLDWQKINSIGNNSDSKDIFPEIKEKEESLKANAYILGMPYDSETAPIFHESDSYFSKNAVEKEPEENLFERQIKIQKQIAAEALKRRLELERLAQMRKLEIDAREMERKLEKEKKEQEKLLALEIQKREIQKQKEILEKMQEENRLKEMAVAEERARLHTEREEKVKLEAQKRKEELQKIAEFNRQQKLSYEESVIADRKKRQEEYEKLLKTEKANKRKEELKNIWWFSDSQKNRRARAKKEKSEKGFLTLGNILTANGFEHQFDLRTNLAAFLVVAILLSSVVSGVSYASKGLSLKDRVLGISQDGLDNLAGAVGDMANQNFEQSNIKFSKALEKFSEGSQDVNEMGSILVTASRYVPFASKVSSGKNALEAGKHFSAAGQALNEIVKVSSQLDSENISLLDVLEKSQEHISKAQIELIAAEENLNTISIDDLPQDKQDKFMLLRDKMPDILAGLDLFLDNNHILVDLLGGNGPRKYLFLFQNNAEMRATGGFIGSYGLLDISNGHVKNFFIDGIFNPDGQLKDRIVPPQPIQKISTNWSMHDSNWFPDFPVSAKKAIYFYERTGGPTTDGVITLTPTVLQKLLEITGPIEMSDYGVTLDSENFIELTQYEVEVDYDKEENKPKKILSDLAPLIMDKLLSSNDLGTISKTADALISGLEEKHILIFSQNASLQNLIAAQGWSGEVHQASADYLSVINSNINGYKTDVVIDEKITHKAEIQSDGSIIDTVTITRKHNGGSSEYEWFNKVNADYMRVYVPQGSRLLEVSGQTREAYITPVDYEALGFKKDSDVESQENSMNIDSETGTRIYEESDKTVFANWVYVSPGETATVTYKYALPFSLFSVSFGEGNQTDSYSLVAQKQSGSRGSEFESSVNFPNEYELKWNFPENSLKNMNEVANKTELKKDRFVGLVFEKKE